MITYVILFLLFYTFDGSHPFQTLIDYAQTIVKQNASPKIIPAILNNMLGKRYIFKLNLTSYNTVKKGEGFTVTQVEEIGAPDPNNALPQAVNLDQTAQLENGNGQNLEGPLENKRKASEDVNGKQNPLAATVVNEPVAKPHRTKRQK